MCKPVPLPEEINPAEVVTYTENSLRSSTASIDITLQSEDHTAVQRYTYSQARDKPYVYVTDSLHSMASISAWLYILLHHHQHREMQQHRLPLNEGGLSFCAKGTSNGEG